MQLQCTMLISLFLLTLGSVSAAPRPARVVSPVIAQAAAKLHIHMREGGTAPAYPTMVIGPVSALSCQQRMTDGLASEAEALGKLRIAAAQAGASDVVDVHFTVGDVDSELTHCWGSIQASGMALRPSAP